MRHDPDIIMIGEIRDSEAAQMAVRCALTGHLVVTSIHASDCTGAVYRMLDLGVHEYQLSDVLGGITSQRLYDRKDQPGRICVYEVMDREEVTYYFRNHEHSSRFRKLPEAVMEAVENGYISLPQAAPDLA
jgi:competence protein ComGA